MASYYKPRPPFGRPVIMPPGGGPPVPTPDPGPIKPPIPPTPLPVPPGGNIPPIVVYPVDPNPPPPVEPLPIQLQPGKWSNGGILIHHGDGGKYFVYKRIGTGVQSFVFSFNEINQDFLNNIVHALRFGAPVIDQEPPNDKLSA